MTHICVSKLTIIGSDNGLSPGRHQAIIWTNAGIMLIGTLEQTSGKSCSKFFHLISRKCIWKCRLEMAAILSRPQCVKYDKSNTGFEHKLRRTLTEIWLWGTWSSQRALPLIIFLHDTHHLTTFRNQSPVYPQFAGQISPGPEMELTLTLNYSSLAWSRRLRLAVFSSAV